MRIIVEIQHPAHIHHFKNMIWNLERKGHSIKICTTDKDVTLSLLNSYGFNYELLGTNDGKISFINKMVLLLKYELRMLDIAKKYKPDLFIARGSPISAHVSMILHKPYIISSDSEPAALFGKLLSFPFADAVYIPSSYNKKLNSNKVIKIDGYKESAYLHPTYFKPDPAVFKELGLEIGSEYMVIRFVAWKAYHDVGQSGLTEKLEVVTELKKYIDNIFISSEGPLPEELRQYLLPTKPSRIHHVLYYAKLLLCDSQTMTTESALLGTPAVRCNSFVGENDMGNFVELEKKYGLIFNYSDSNKALGKAIELLQEPSLKESWMKKRELLLKDKIDVTGFMTWFIENYPQSFTVMKENPDFQYQFKAV